MEAAVFLKAFPKFTDDHAARTGVTGREGITSRVISADEGRDWNNGEEGGEENRNRMMQMTKAQDRGRERVY